MVLVICRRRQNEEIQPSYYDGREKHRALLSHAGRGEDPSIGASKMGLCWTRHEGSSETHLRIPRHNHLLRFQSKSLKCATGGNGVLL